MKVELLSVELDRYVVAFTPAGLAQLSPRQDNAQAVSDGLQFPRVHSYAIMPNQEGRTMFGGQAEVKEPDFGQNIDLPLQKGGLADMATLQALVDHCGCVDETGAEAKVATLPFQGFAYVNRERWVLRIEMPGVFAMPTGNRFGCPWSFALAGGVNHPNR